MRRHGRAPGLAPGLILWLCCALTATAAPRNAFRKNTQFPASFEIERTPGLGQVRYVTTDTAYLDRGSGDGLKVGHTLQFVRRKRRVGSCVVTQVVPHSAVCSTKALQVGDRFGLPVLPDAPRPKLLPPPPSAPELERRRRLVEDATVELAEYRGGTGTIGGVTGRLLRAGLSHTTYASYTATGGPVHEERLDLRLDGYAVGPARVFLDLTALHLARTPPSYRAPHTAATRLYLWQAEVALRQPRSSFAGAAGRTWPQNIPGLPLLDGAHGAYRSESGAFEAGGFAGALPDPVTLSPSLDRWTAGGYFAGRWLGGDAWLAQPSMRLAFVRREPTAAPRLETEAYLHASAGDWLFGNAQVRASLGSPSAIEGAHLFASTRLLERLRWSGALRYRAPSTPDVVPLGGASPLRTLHADSDAAFDVLPWMTVSAQWGLARDLETGQLSWRAGPELAFTSLLHRTLSLAFGYQEEGGWLVGRSGYAQVASFPFAWLRLLARSSLFIQTGGTNAQGWAGREVGLFVSADARVAPWLAVGASLMGRMQLLRAEASDPAGAVASVRLSGEY